MFYDDIHADQMMTSFSLYVLLQIKLNKYIKRSIYWKKKKYLQQKISDIL